MPRARPRVVRRITHKVHAASISKVQRLPLCGALCVADIAENSRAQLVELLDVRAERRMLPLAARVRLGFALWRGIKLSQKLRDGRCAALGVKLLDLLELERHTRPVDGCTTNGDLSRWFCRLVTSASMRGYVYCNTISSKAAIHAGRARSALRAAASSTSSHFCTDERGAASQRVCSRATSSVSCAGSSASKSSQRGRSRKQSWSRSTTSTNARCSGLRNVALPCELLDVPANTSVPSARRRLG